MGPLEPLRGLWRVEGSFLPRRAGLQCSGPRGRSLGQKESSDPSEGLEVAASCPPRRPRSCWLLNSGS